MFRYYITFIMLLLIAVLTSLVVIAIDLNRQDGKDSDDVKLSKLTIIIIIILLFFLLIFYQFFGKQKQYNMMLL